MQTEAAGAPLSVEQHPGGSQTAKPAPEAARGGAAVQREAPEVAAPLARGRQVDLQAMRHDSYKAATHCKTEDCDQPVKRNKRGHGMGRCEEHYGLTGIHRSPGSRLKLRGGYVQVKLDDGRFLAEHRWVTEQQLGRPLVRGENVHHKNGVRDDNRPENLELWYTPQPRGQRVEDLLRYAVNHHRAALEALLGSAAALPSPRITEGASAATTQAMLKETQ